MTPTIFYGFIGTMGNDLRETAMLYSGLSYVYLFLTRDPSVNGSPVYLKVGFSSHPISRMMAIQTGCPTPIFKFSCIQTRTRKQAQELEILLHSGLAELKTFGEWFRIEWDQVGKRAELFGIIESRCRSLLGDKWRMQEVEVPEARKLFIKHSFAKVRPQRSKKLWREESTAKVAKGALQGQYWTRRYDGNVSDVDFADCF